MSEVRLTDEGCADTPRVGSSAWIDWKTHLGYALRLRVTTTRVLAPFELEGTADGDLNGHGLWLLEPQGGDGVAITYRWDVSLTRRWMRWSSPLLRPVFAWNHGEAMGAGARAMAGVLGCHLLHYQDYQFVPRDNAADPKRWPWEKPLALRAYSRRRRGACG